VDLVQWGVRPLKPFFARVYNPNEITSLLEQSGFIVENIYGDYDEETPFDQSRRMVVVARK
jgi:hypothetical protein